MSPPAFVAAGTYLVAARSAAPAFAVPAGATAGHVALVHMYKENFAAITPPAGFTECTNSPIATSNHSQHIFWKRLTGADSGTYTFTWTGATYVEGCATLWNGCLSSGDPTEIDNAAQISSSTNTTPAVSGTTLGTDRLLVWSGTTFFTATTWTVPTGGWTRRDSAAGTGDLCVAGLPQAAAGATGSVSGTTSTSQQLTGFLLALVPDVVVASGLYLPIQVIQVP